MLEEGLVLRELHTQRREQRHEVVTPDIGVTQGLVLSAPILSHLVAKGQDRLQIAEYYVVDPLSSLR